MNYERSKGDFTIITGNINEILFNFKGVVNSIKYNSVIFHYFNIKMHLQKGTQIDFKLNTEMQENKKGEEREEE